MLRVVRLLALGSIVAAAPAMWAQHTHFPNSEWKLDAAASDFGEGPKMQSDVFMIHTDTEKELTYDDDTVDGDGKTWKTSWAGPQDGTMKPIKGMEGAKAGFKTEDDSSRFEMSDGSWSESTMKVSDDKKTVTIHVNGKTKDGKDYTQTLVYNRVK